MARDSGPIDSFNGNFVVAAPLPNGRRRAFGAFAPDRGRSRIMHSVTGFEQEQAAHIQQSELCATCHTLVTVARGPDGAVIGSLSTSSSPRVHARRRMLRVLRGLVTSICIRATLLFDLYKSSRC